MLVAPFNSTIFNGHICRLFLSNWVLACKISVSSYSFQIASLKNFFFWQVRICLIICSCWKLLKVLIAILKTFFCREMFGSWWSCHMTTLSPLMVQALIFVGPINSETMRCFMSIPVTSLRKIQLIVSIKWRVKKLWLVDFKINFAEWLPGMKMKRTHPTGTSFWGHNGVRWPATTSFW